MRRRVKKKAIIVLIIIILLIISGICLTKYIKKVNSTKYKLEKLGYTKEETTEILKLDKEKIDDIMKLEYNEDLVNLLKEKYFIYENLDRYINYKKENPKTSIKDTISLVNVNRDSDYYTNITKTDTEKGILMLVNKYHNLTKDYTLDDLVEVSNQHCYGTQKIKEEAYSKFKEMFNAAKKENLTIIINSSYRTYEYQDDLWKSYADKNGDEWADSYAARAGHSEHQTGLAIDVTTYGVVNQEDFETKDAFKWLQDNAYKYGYILRYPKGKENITGYSYESWHYRYVGTEVATIIHEENITYDEYYAYYMK